MHSPLWASLFCRKKSSVVAANFLLPPLPTQHSTRWQLQAARSLSFVVSKRKQILSCRHFTGLQHFSEPPKQMASARETKLLHRAANISQRGETGWEQLWEHLRECHLMQQRKKRQRIIQGKDVRTKDTVQERCPEQEKSEKHNCNVRKQHGMGLVIHANVKGTGNKGNWAQRALP